MWPCNHCNVADSKAKLQSDDPSRGAEPCDRLPVVPGGLHRPALSDAGCVMNVGYRWL